MTTKLTTKANVERLAEALASAGWEAHPVDIVAFATVVAAEFDAATARLPINGSDRTAIARLAAHSRWSRMDKADRLRATEKARRAIDDQFVVQARREHPGINDDDLAETVKSLRSAHAVRAANARWARYNRLNPSDLGGGRRSASD